jgi:outer membrane protein assembly factor BamA
MITFRRSSMRIAPFAILLSSIALPATAQYTVGKVVFKNPGTYIQADLEATAGMHSGQKFSTDDLQTAAQKLSDTGYFDDVGAGLLGSVSAIQVIFTLKPLDASHLTPVGFENFVWLTPEELAAAIHTAAPLFHGGLPDAGTQADMIGAGLTAALAAKGVNGVVTHRTLETSATQPVRAVEFRVDQPSVLVHSISLQGVSPVMSPMVNAIAARLKGTPYNEGLAGEKTQDRLLAPYTEAGYLNAKLTGARFAMSADGVDVTAAVDEGAAYRVASIDFTGAPLATAAAASAKLHPGDVASRKALRETLAPVEAAYRRQGYMDVVVDAGAALDNAAHTVTYTVTAVPGPQYRVGSINAVGLDPAARKDFDRGWLMKPGEVYSAEYATGFLKNNSALQALANYSAGFKASADPQTHLVDVTLTFVRGGGAR